jgi:hypothetical protein
MGDNEEGVAEALFVIPVQRVLAKARPDDRLRREPGISRFRVRALRRIPE